MTQAPTLDTAPPAAATDLAGIGARGVPEVEGVHDGWPRGVRLEAQR